MHQLKDKPWWGYIHEDLRELLQESLVLCQKAATWDERFHDYAFVVFPAAKAYEGFLKTLFLDLGFITEGDFYGRRFRIGRSLNPALEARYREKEGVYDRLVDFRGGRELADKLWDAWRECRNILFHWFPNERNAIDLKEAKAKVDMVVSTIDLAFKECKINRVKEQGS